MRQVDSILEKKSAGITKKKTKVDTRQTIEVFLRSRQQNISRFEENIQLWNRFKNQSISDLYQGGTVPNNDKLILSKIKKGFDLFKRSIILENKSLELQRKQNELRSKGIILGSTPAPRKATEINKQTWFVHLAGEFKAKLLSFRADLNQDSIFVKAANGVSHEITKLEYLKRFPLSFPFPKEIQNDFSLVLLKYLQGTSNNASFSKKLIEYLFQTNSLIQNKGIIESEKIFQKFTNAVLNFLNNIESEAIQHEFSRIKQFLESLKRNGKQNELNETKIRELFKISSVSVPPAEIYLYRHLCFLIVTNRITPLNPINNGNGAGNHLLTAAGLKNLRNKQNFCIGPSVFSKIMGTECGKSLVLLLNSNPKTSAIRNSKLDAVILRAYDPKYFSSSSLANKIWAGIQHHISGSKATNKKNGTLYCESAVGTPCTVTFNNYAQKRILSLSRNNFNSKLNIADVVGSLLVKKYNIISSADTKSIYYKSLVLKLNPCLKSYFNDNRMGVYIKNGKYFDVLHYIFVTSPGFKELFPNSTIENVSKIFLISTTRSNMNLFAKAFYGC
tara:strand:- start:7294 stop:8973 length:1680 start_codon:yes stop_codon:yes gene_type:complete